MKSGLLSILFIFIAFIAISQTTVFHENFELPSLDDSVNSVGSQTWNINTSFYSEGSYSIYVGVPNSDTVSLESNSFSTLGNFHVMLYFSHICKLEHFDNGVVEVSIDNGISWNSLPASTYLGTAQYGTLANRFTATSYPVDWDPTNNNSVPNNTWWKNETFDISSIASNSAQVKVRFRLYNGINGLPGSAGAFGWLVDDIKVVIAPSEFDPPVISAFTSNPTDTIFQTGPFDIYDTITDVSGIATAKIVYSLNNGSPDTIVMSPISNTIFKGTIPSYSYNNKINYQVFAIDSTISANIGYSTPKWFYIKKNSTAVKQIRDAGVSHFIEPTAVAYTTSTLPVKIRIKNYSNLPLIKATIGWTDNGVTKPSFVWTGNLLEDQVSNSINIGSYPFSLGMHSIKIWTSLPNDSSDLANANDTLTTTVMVCNGQYNGTYTVGNNGDDFISLPIAFQAIQNCGIGGNVKLLMSSGTYGQVIIPAIAGMDSTKTITIESASSNAADVVFTYSASGTADNYVVRFNGSKYFKIKNVSIIANGTTYGKAVEYLAQASNNILEGNIISSANATTSAVCPIYSSSLLNNYNSIINNTISGGYYGIYFQGITTSSKLKGLKIEGNTIKNVNSYGVYLSYVDSLILTNNFIKNLSGATPSTYYSIYSNYNDNVSITRNQLEANTSATKYGLYLYNVNTAGGGQTIGLIENNSISIFGSGTTSYGIYAYGNYRVKYYHNSVQINDASTTSGYPFYQSGGDSIVMKNNSFVNLKTGYALYLTGTAGPIIASDYNNLFTNGSTFCSYYGSAKATFAAYKTAANKDTNSVSANPPYYGNTDLHTSSMVLSGKGTPTSIFDIDGEVRDTLLPDIGADEYTLYNNNAGVSNFVSSQIVCPNTQVPVVVSVKNFGISDLTSCTINWTINGVLQTPYSITDTIPIFQSKNYTIGNTTYLYGTTYDFKFWTSMPNGGIDSVNTNDTLWFANYKTSMGAGVYKIGGINPDFTNINAAINYMNTYGICGAVTFELRDGVYNENIVINQIQGASINNTITFKPEAGATVQIIGNSSATIKLNGADFIIIDGSNNGTESRNLTVQNVSTAIKTAVIWFSSLGANQGANYNVVKNCVIKGSSPYIFKHYGIFMAGTAIDSTALGADNDYNILENNEIKNTRYGIYAKGSSNTTKFNNLIIKKNKIGSDIPSEYITTIAMELSFLDSALITQNEIFNLENSGPFNMVGIQMLAGLSNCMVTKNKIHDMRQKYMTAGIANIGINFSVGDTNNIVANNMIWNILSYASNATYFAVGIRVNGGSANRNVNNKVYYNTVYMNGTLYSGNASVSTALYIGTSTNVIGSDIRNNIFANNIQGGTGSKSYAVYAVSGYSLDKLGWNNYYSTNGYLGFNGSDRLTLADWKAAVPFDSNSVSVNPYFYSSTDVHSASSVLNGAAKPISTILDDIDGNTRSVTTPDIGADEFDLYTNDAGIKSFNIAKNFCSGSQDISVNMANYGNNTISSVTINWSINGILQTPYNYVGTLSAPSDTTLILGSYNFQNQIINNFKFWTTQPNSTTDGNLLNDTLIVNSIAHSLSAGTYTVGDATSNFLTIQDAANYSYNYGICGPVVFDIKSGTYNDQVIIKQVPGASDVNTVTYKSMANDSTAVTLTFTPTQTSDPSSYSLFLDGADYIRIKKMTITTGAAANGIGRPIGIANGANHNIFESNRIICPINPSTAIAGIYKSQSTKDDYNLIQNNMFLGGQSGIIWNGSSATIIDEGNNFVNNTIQNFSASGLTIMNQDSILIKGNLISSLSSVASPMGMKLVNLDSNSLITANKINIKGSSTPYGINLSNSTGSNSNSGLISNNFISIEGTGTAGAGIYLSAVTRYNVYHNSINAKLPGNSAYSIYVTGGGTINLQNNNFVNIASGYAYYIASPAAITTSNYNNIFSPSGKYAYWTVDKANLVDLQSASSKEQNSINATPKFNTFSDLHSISSQLNNAGTFLVSVPVDIDEEVRSNSTPDIGADEFVAPLYEPSVTSYSLPIKACGLDSIPVIINITNQGSDTLKTGLTAYWKLKNKSTISEVVSTPIPPNGTIPFTFSVKAPVSSANDTTFQFTAWVFHAMDPLHLNDTATLNLFAGPIRPVPTLTPITINFGTSANLTATGIDSIRWYVSDTATSYFKEGSNYTTPILFGSKTYWVEVRGGNGGAGCPSPRIPYTVVVNGIPLVNLSISKITVNQGCGLTNAENVKIRIHNTGLQAANGGINAQFKVDNQLWNTLETISDTIQAGDSLDYTFISKANLFSNVDTNFTITAAIGHILDTYPINDTLKLTNIISMRTPVAPVVTSPVNILYAHSTQLQAQSIDSVYWYADDTTSTVLHVGTSFTTPILYDTTKYYVQAVGAALTSTLPILGTGTVTNSSNSFPSPYGNYYWGSKDQYLIRASELTALGITAGNISSLAFDVSNVNTCPALQNYEIKMGSTSQNAITSTWITGLTSKYANPSYQPVVGWNTHNFTSPFYWDGVSNVVVEVCFNNSSFKSNASVRQSSTSFVSTANYHTDNSTVCSNPGSATTYSQRPNIRINSTSIVSGCSSPKIPIVVNVGTPYPNDAGITNLVSPIATASNNIAVPIEVKVKNYGLNTLNSVSIGYKVNGIYKTTYIASGLNLPKDSVSAPITIYTDTFTGGITKLQIYTTLPNNAQDSSNFNDSLITTINVCLSGTYTVGNSQNSYFQTISDAINTLKITGVCGNTIFKLDTGIYNTQILLTNIPSLSASSRLTIESASSDSSKVVIQYAANSANDNYVVRLDNAKYVTFRKITLKSASITTYSRVIELINGSSNNTISNCEVRSTSASNSSNNAIYMYTNCHYNKIENNLLFGGYNSVYLYGSSSLKCKSNQVIGNTITDFYSGGVYLNYQDSTLINGNFISSNIGSNMYGVNSNNSDGTYILGNNIQVKTGYGYGIYCYYNNNTGSKTTYIANNFISKINPGNLSYYGMYLSSVKNAKIVNNSLFVQDSYSATRGIYQTGGSNQSYMNNVIACPGGCIPFYVTTTAAIDTSNYNDYYTTGSVLGYWGTNCNNLASLKSISGKETNSISINPVFASNTNLHTQKVELNNAGKKLDYNIVDIDGEFRNLSTSDIGADEFTPPQNDAGLDSVSAPLSPITILTQPVIVKLYNGGIDTLKTVFIDWMVDGNLQTYSWSGNLPAANYTYATLGNYTFNSGVHQIKAWVRMPNGFSDIINYNDTVSTKITACSSPLKGTYTIGGASADYSSFSDAVSYLNSCGIDSSVVFMVNNGTYTEQISIGAVYGSSATNTITFKSASNDSTAVILTYGNSTASSNYIVRLNGASYVTFRNMTIVSTNASNGNAVVLSNGAHHNQFLNNKIKSSSTTISTNNAIFFSQGTNENFNSIINNKIENGYYGIYQYGIATTNGERGNIIENNEIINFGSTGIFLNYADSFIVRNNNIHSSGGSTSYGINIIYGYNSFRIENNRIVCNGSTSNQALRFYYGNYNNPTAAEGQICNNFLATTAGSGTNYSMYLYYTERVKIYYNSINTSSGSPSSYGFYATNSSTQTGVEIVNNIFNNSAGGYAAYYPNVAAIIESNYNDYFTSGNNLAYWGAACPSLADLQTKNGMDTNSLNLDPGFVSNSNLHLVSGALNGKATPIASITTDIDGNLRNLNTPDMGADEFSPVGKDAGSMSFIQPSLTYGPIGTTINVEFNFRNFGTDTIFNMTLGYKVDTNTAVTYNWSGVLAPNTIASYLFASSLNLPIGAHKIKAFTSMSQDVNNANDTIEFNYITMPLMSLSYTDNFDQATSLWATSGNQNLWERGIPSGSNLNSAHSTPNVWGTKLSGNYGSNANEYLYTPYFDFSNVTNANMSFWHKYMTEATNDYCRIQYSTNLGQTWSTLGYISDPAATNWYTSQTSGQHGWSGTSNWKESTFNLSQFDNSVTAVQFRFQLYSNGSIENEGWIIDDFKISLPAVAVDVKMDSILTPKNSMALGSSDSVRIRIKNLGTSTLTSIPVYYRVNSAPVVNAIWTGTLPTGASTNFTFPTVLLCPNGTSFTLCVKTNVSGDAYTHNDSLVETIQINPAHLDAGITQILNPLGGNDTTCIGKKYSVKVVVKNFGTDTLHSINLKYALTNGFSKTETWSGTLSPGNSINYSFIDSFVAPPSNYQICSKAMLIGDLNPSNDSICKYLIGHVCIGLEDVWNLNFALDQNIPNPSRGNTLFNFEVPKAGKLKFSITNLLGQEVKSELLDVQSGINSINFDLSSFDQGIYYYSIKFENHKLTKKLVLIK